MIEHLNIAASAAVGGGQVGQIGYKEIFQRRLRFVAVEKCVDIIFGKEICDLVWRVCAPVAGGGHRLPVCSAESGDMLEGQAAAHIGVARLQRFDQGSPVLLQIGSLDLGIPLPVSEENDDIRTVLKHAVVWNVAPRLELQGEVTCPEGVGRIYVDQSHPELALLRDVKSETAVMIEFFVPVCMIDQVGDELLMERLHLLIIIRQLKKLIQRIRETFEQRLLDERRRAGKEVTRDERKEDAAFMVGAHDQRGAADVWRQGNLGDEEFVALIVIPVYGHQIEMLFVIESVFQNFCYNRIFVCMGVGRADNIVGGVHHQRDVAGEHLPRDIKERLVAVALQNGGMQADFVGVHGAEKMEQPIGDVVYRDVFVQNDGVHLLSVTLQLLRPRPEHEAYVVGQSPFELEQQARLTDIQDVLLKFGHIEGQELNTGEDKGLLPDQIDFSAKRIQRFSDKLKRQLHFKIPPL